jgi:hypothetical protein
MPDICEMNRPRVAGAGLPVRALMSADGGIPAGTTIRVVNGRTGIEGDCVDYSETKQKCFRWAGEPRKPQARVAAVQPQKTLAKPKPEAKPAPKTEPAKATEPPKPAEEKKT